MQIHVYKPYTKSWQNGVIYWARKTLMIKKSLEVNVYVRRVNKVITTKL